MKGEYPHSPVFLFFFHLSIYLFPLSGYFVLCRFHHNFLALLVFFFPMLSPLFPTLVYLDFVLRRVPVIFCSHFWFSFSDLQFFSLLFAFCSETVSL